ncbi:ATP-binding cassette domain-containing protein [Rhodococcus hoagii]|nr:ATP-binding cassette domain-containing protein [Prescottella equi]
MRGADTHNLRDVDVDIPLGVLTVVTGVAGSGKSSLIGGSVVGRTVWSRSIRARSKAHAAATRRRTRACSSRSARHSRRPTVSSRVCSVPTPRRLPQLQRRRRRVLDLAMMAVCPRRASVCEGKRFQAEVLDYKFGGKDINEVLTMSVAQAEEFFGAGDAKLPAAHKILARLVDVGLGYIKIGQPLTTLSGGERQRLKLATHMGRRATSTSSTSRRPVCISPTSRICSACWTGSSTPVRRSSSSNITRLSWPTPTGSSIWVPAPATTAAASSSRARPRTSSRTVRPSPASISRSTSVVEHPRPTHQYVTVTY